MSQEPKPITPTPTLRRILEGLPPSDHPLDQAVWRVEQSLDRLEQQLRQRAAETSDK